MENHTYSDDFQLEMETTETAAEKEGRQPPEQAREGAAAEMRGAVRLRRPERGQMAWVAQCGDDLVPAEHPVRRIWEVVKHLDVSGFYATIKAREGVAGRDTTDPRLLVALWLYACVRGIGAARAPTWRGALSATALAPQEQAW